MTNDFILSQIQKLEKAQIEIADKSLFTNDQIEVYKFRKNLEKGINIKITDFQRMNYLWQVYKITKNGNAEEFWTKIDKLLADSKFDEAVKIFQDKRQCKKFVAEDTLLSRLNEIQEIEKECNVTYDLVLTKCAGDSKIQTIKIIRGVAQLGLREAKKLTDVMPSTIISKKTREEIEDMKGRFSHIKDIELKIVESSDQESATTTFKQTLSKLATRR